MDAFHTKYVTVSTHQWEGWDVVLVTKPGTTEIVGMAVVPGWSPVIGSEAISDQLAGRYLHTPKETLSAVDLRKMPIRKMLAGVPDPEEDSPALASVESWPKVLWEKDMAAEFGLTPSDLSALDYLRDAYLYADAVETGAARPVVRVSTQLGHASRQTTAGRLTTARRVHGLLTEPKPGQVAGDLTPKARRLIEVMDCLISRKA